MPNISESQLAMGIVMQNDGKEDVTYIDFVCLHDKSCIGDFLLKIEYQLLETSTILLAKGNVVKIR